MTKIQRASIYLFHCLQELAEFELGHLSQQEFSQSPGRQRFGLKLVCLSCNYYPALSLSNDWPSSYLSQLCLMDCHVWRCLRSRLVELFRQ